MITKENVKNTNNAFKLLERLVKHHCENYPHRTLPTMTITKATARKCGKMEIEGGSLEFMLVEIVKMVDAIPPLHCRVEQGKGLSVYLHIF